MIHLSKQVSRIDWELFDSLKPYMTRDAEELYVYIRTRATLECKPLEAKALAKRMKWSQARLYRALEWLDANGFIDIYEEG